MARKILLTFNGNQDPLNHQGEPGPILSLLSHKKQIDAVYLFHTNDKISDAMKTADAIRANYSKTAVELYSVNLDDPIDYQALLRGIRGHIPALLREEPPPEYLVLLSPGSPQMHSSWFMLVASGEIPARLCQTRQPQFINPAKGWGPVVEIDPRASWFPDLVVHRHDIKAPSKSEPEDITKALEDAGIIGSQKTIQYIIDQAVKPAMSDETICIFGESGTGKELLARFIHHMSRRRHHTFLDVNCATLPENMIETELFGHEKGAFTGATERKPGKFELAEGGTLFLDEIGDMSLAAQVKILRAIQNKSIHPLGSKNAKPKEVNVRILTATNKHLGDMVKKGLFREDLYHRLNVFPMTLPPLRERREDIAILANYFVEKKIGEQGEKKRLTNDAVNLLSKYSWPGNIRQLKNAIDRAFILCDDEMITPDHFNLVEEEDNAWSLPEFGEGFKLDDFLVRYEGEMIQKAMKMSKSQADAARLLGISKQALNKKLKKGAA